MSTVDRVQQWIMDALIRGEWEPGTWVRQGRLADQLRVSKIPVREALQRVAATGLLRFESNRGVLVTELTVDEATENFALRRVLEPRLLQQAMTAVTLVDLAEAEMALAATHLSPSEANWLFHWALYRSSGFKRGLAMVETLHASAAPYVGLYTEALGGGSESDREHVELLEACRVGDQERARVVLVNHIDRAYSTLAGYLRAGGADR